MVTMTAPHERDPKPDRDDDAVFRQIIAGFGQDPEDATERPADVVENYRE